MSTPLRKAKNLNDAIKGARSILSHKDGEWVGIILKAESEKALIPKDIEYRIDEQEYPYKNNCIVGYVGLDEPYGTNKRIYTYSPKGSRKAYPIDKDGRIKK